MGEAESRKPSKGSVQAKLEEELSKLKERVGLGPELKVIWAPNPESSLSGEVRNGTLLIYEPDEDKAIQTLRHEYIDFLVSQAIEPYKSIANKLIQLLNEIAYKRKEEIVEILAKLLS